MTEFAEFLSGLLDGMVLLGMTLAIGGLTYLFVVLRLDRDTSAVMHGLGRQTLRVAAAGAMAATATRLLELAMLKPLAIAEYSGEWEFPAFTQTQAFQVNLLSIVLLALLGGSLVWLGRNTAGRHRRVIPPLLAVAVLVTETRLTHAVSRVGDSRFVITATVAHMAGAMIWAGGIMHLILSWRQRHEAHVAQAWPALVARFSGLGIPSVALIVSSGLYLAWRYVGEWQGLVGTAYGNVLLAKVVLFTCVVVLATLNYRAAQRWRRARESEPLLRHAPAYIEVEVVLATALLFAAAALSSHPPAADVIRDRVPPQEMWLMFSPKLPHLSGPETILWERPELTDPQTGEPGYEVNLSRDRFQHNVAGLLVVVAAVLGTLNRMIRKSWTTHWPLLFVAFGIYDFVVGDPDYFPFGEVGFLESVQNSGLLQHWLLTGTVATIGWLEWRGLQQGRARPRLPYLVPGIWIAGGILLLVHSHNDFFRLRIQYLTLGPHIAIGTAVIIIGCARWLELRSPPPVERIAGWVATGIIFLVGVSLLFYVDPEDSLTWESLKKVQIAGEHPG